MQGRQPARQAIKDAPGQKQERHCRSTQKNATGLLQNQGLGRKWRAHGEKAKKVRGDIA